MLVVWDGFQPPSGDPSVPISELMGFLYDQLVALGNRKTPVRLAILDALHSLILQLDFSESSTEELDVLLAQVSRGHCTNSLSSRCFTKSPPEPVGNRRHNHV